jgi:P4 family phage/plasmid primase-like protien
MVEKTISGIVFSQIPINWRNKRPAILTWEEYQTRLPTPEEIETWKKDSPQAWANILGHISGDVYVVDVDSLSAELTVIGRWMKHLGPTYTVASSGYAPDDPTSGKRHFYLKDASGVRLKKKKFEFEKVSTDARVCHVDLQGEGSYVLTAGSMHPSGSIYTVVDPSEIKGVSYERVVRILKLIMKHWLLVETVAGQYPVGSRHYVALAFGGYLLHHGFDREEALILGRTLGYAAIDPPSLEDDIEKIELAINQTFDRDAEGIQVGYKAADVGDIGWPEELVDAVERLSNKVKFSTSKEEKAEEEFRERMGLVEDGKAKAPATPESPTEAVPSPPAPVVILKTPKTGKDKDEEETPTVVFKPEEMVIEPFYQEGYERKVDPATYPQTDYGNAEQMYARFGGYIRWMPETGFMIWSGQRWIRDPGDTTVMKLAMYSARLMLRDMDPGMDKAERKSQIKWSVASESRALIKNCLELLKTLVVTNINDFDKNPWLFNVQNGTIDLQTGKLKPHDRNDLITVIAAVSFDERATCPRWRQFQEEIEPDASVRDWKKKFFGYCLTGDTRERVFGIAIGEQGANGKSTEKETLLMIVGDYGAVTTFSMISTDSSDDRVRNELARLKGKRFVVASESDERMTLAESVVKEITGRDTIRARLLYQQAFEYQPLFKIWLVTNTKPTIKATTNPIWDRVLPIEYTKTFIGPCMDRLLPQKLAAEASGILNWLIEGCLEWQNAGSLPKVNTIEKFKRQYRLENDSVLEFIETMMEPNPAGVVSYSEFVSQYNMWAGRERKFTFTSGKQIGKHIQLARDPDGQPYIVPAQNSDGQRIYRGISFKTSGAAQMIDQTMLKEQTLTPPEAKPDVQNETTSIPEGSKTVCSPESSVTPPSLEETHISPDDKTQFGVSSAQSGSYEPNFSTRSSGSSGTKQATLEQAAPELGETVESTDVVQRAVRAQRLHKAPTSAQREETLGKLVEAAEIYFARAADIGQTSWEVADLEETLLGLYRVPSDSDIVASEIVAKMPRLKREGDRYVYR